MLFPYTTLFRSETPPPAPASYRFVAPPLSSSSLGTPRPPRFPSFGSIPAAPVPAAGNTVFDTHTLGNPCLRLDIASTSCHLSWTVSRTARSFPPGTASSCSLPGLQTHPAETPDRFPPLSSTLPASLPLPPAIHKNPSGSRSSP